MRDHARRPCSVLCRNVLEVKAALDATPAFQFFVPLTSALDLGRCIGMLKAKL